MPTNLGSKSDDDDGFGCSCLMVPAFAILAAALWFVAF